MGIALTLQQYLDDNHIAYDVMVHKRTHCAFDTARASHVPGERLAKAVVLTREGGFVVAVVPATARVRLDTIERMLHCPVGLASEDEISEMFPDCDSGRGAAGAGGLRGRCVHRRELRQAARRLPRGRRPSQPRAHDRASSSARSCRTCSARASPSATDGNGTDRALDDRGLVEMRDDQREDVARGVLAEDAVDVPVARDHVALVELAPVRLRQPLTVRAVLSGLKQAFSAPCTKQDRQRQAVDVRQVDVAARCGIEQAARCAQTARAA